MHFLLSILQLLSQQLHSSFPRRGCFLKKSDLQVLSIGLAVGLLQLRLCGLEGVLQLVVACLLALKGRLQPALLRIPLLNLGLQQGRFSDRSVSAQNKLQTTLAASVEQAICYNSL